MYGLPVDINFLSKTLQEDLHVTVDNVANEFTGKPSDMLNNPKGMYK